MGQTRTLVDFSSTEHRGNKRGRTILGSVDLSEPVFKLFEKLSIVKEGVENSTRLRATLTSIHSQVSDVYAKSRRTLSVSCELVVSVKKD